MYRAFNAVQALKKINLENSDFAVNESTLMSAFTSAYIDGFNDAKDMVVKLLKSTGHSSEIISKVEELEYRYSFLSDDYR